MDNNLLCLENDEHNCSICLDVIGGEFITLQKCKHRFHNSCLSMWFEKNNTCPLCRETILDMYNAKWKKKTFWGEKNVKVVSELKENKIIFYEVIKIKKNRKSRITQNYNFNQVNPDLVDDNLNFQQNLNLELRDKNFVLNLNSDEIIGSVIFQILYSDIFRVSYQKNRITFHNLKIKEGVKNAIRIKNKKNKIKLKFPSINLANHFFNILQKRHRYFTETN